MIENYKYLNGHSPDIMNDIFKLRENMLFHIWQQVPIDIHEAPSLTLFKNCIQI